MQKLKLSSLELHWYIGFFFPHSFSLIMVCSKVDHEVLAYLFLVPVFHNFEDYSHHHLDRSFRLSKTVCLSVVVCIISQMAVNMYWLVDFSAHLCRGNLSLIKIFVFLSHLFPASPPLLMYWKYIKQTAVS